MITEFASKFPVGTPIQTTIDGMLVVASSHGEECFHYVAGATDLIKWQVQHNFFSGLIGRACLEQVWIQQGLGEPV